MIDRKPLLVVTMGDPAGAGAEIIAKVASDPTAAPNASLLCVGDAGVMARAFEAIGKPPAMHRIQDVSEVRLEDGVLNILDLQNVDAQTLHMGEVQAAAGQAAFEYITHAIQLALAGKVDGVITSGIHKEALHLAGHKFDGHTEIFAAQTGARQVTMMLAAGDFRVTHVSTHCSLREAINRCKRERILTVIRLTNVSLKQLGLVNPRIGVAGINPHSGEGGLFGYEEIEEIQPAIDSAREEGINVSERPEPPDTVFVRMKEKREFDAVVAQYHDQGHIAAKIVDFFGGVNITLGLPIIRTSVDHGTAFDIAGTGKANPQSLMSAIEYARRLALGLPSVRKGEPV